MRAVAALSVSVEKRLFLADLKKIERRGERTNVSVQTVLMRFPDKATSVCEKCHGLLGQGGREP